jgi:hypothetical protein
MREIASKSVLILRSGAWFEKPALTLRSEP